MINIIIWVYKFLIIVTIGTVIVTMCLLLGLLFWDVKFIEIAAETLEYIILKD